MAKAYRYVMDAGDQNFLPNYLFGVRRMQKTRLTKKLLVTVRRDLQDMKLSWQDAKELSANKDEWLSRVVQLCRSI